MKAIGCNSFFAAAGWSCRVIETGGMPATYISTPVILPGGKPLDFYLITKGELIEFTDDGLTMFALSGLGFQLSDKRNWRGLENIAIKYGFKLSDSGAFEALFAKHELPDWGGRIVRLFAALAEWEADRFAEGDSDFSLTEEVEMLLRAKAPDSTIIRNPSLRLGKADISFDFLWGDVYVDAIRPIAQSVNSRLRKAVLINREENAPKLLFIVDDRENPERAEAEIGVLGDIASTIRLTDFERHYSPAIH
ncbi:DUF1828 domain-containing protein [Pseudomonas oryzihabitans]|uniref:DUF1828 domain-containing protein n=1 Tax=Pseudomonas oryzihabitans TaxID=47885 RepID=UPI0015E355AA|nr:DUF1828 domain-containing protein [Pseudomonas psychrotolerans]MBA1213401.1 DUF1828 domain-containing protein [Pseudomonas psychrotolerans]